MWFHLPKRIISAICLCVICVAASLASADNNEGGADRTMGHGSASGIVVANVNGTDLNMSQLMNRMFDIAEKRYGRREITPMMANQIKSEAVDQLVAEELAYQEASKHVVISPEELSKVVQQNIAALGGEEGLDGYIKQYQMSGRDAYTEQIRRFLLVKKYIQQEIVAKINISDEAIKAAYLEAKERYFTKAEVVQITKITFFADPKSPEALAKALALREKVITEYDNQTSGLVPDGTFIVQENIQLDKKQDAILYEKARVLGEFEWSQPVEENGTLHLMQLTGYQPGSQKEFSEVKDYIRNELRGRVQQDRMQEWREGLKKGAKIKIFDLDLG